VISRTEEDNVTNLTGKRIAILATNGFEQSELLEPQRALQTAGAETRVVSLEKGEIKGWTANNWGQAVPVDLTIDEAQPDDFDGLLLPGGVMNPDRLRLSSKAVQFARAFFDAHKPIAAICHGPWLLVEAGIVKGRTLTSWRSLKTDIVNAGGKWVDQEVVNDAGLITSRMPADIPAFNRAMITALEGAGVKAGVPR
jgi:protease I